MATALITGGSKGLGRALSLDLVRAGWRVVTDARTAADLTALSAAASGPGQLATLAGDVTDPEHLGALAGAAGPRLDLLVLNASTLGTTPLPPLATYDLDTLAHVLGTNTIAPIALVQLTLPAIRAAHGRIIAVSSDAAVEGYEGWGAYGASKAALDQLMRVLGAEQTDLRVYAVDPGDMRTDMHQAAFPEDDISDRPEPSTVVPAFRRLIEGELPSGRYAVASLQGVAA